jgi:hypothetical protein
MVRAYDALTGGGLHDSFPEPREALADLARDPAFAGDTAIRLALGRAVLDSDQPSRSLVMVE